MTKSFKRQLYAIRPMLSGQQICWSVELVRQGSCNRKVFTAFRYGSTEAALSAAIQWRDEMVKTVMPVSRADYSCIERSNNTSGYPGVYAMKTIKKDKSGQTRVYMAWEARTPTGIKPAKKKSFSVLRYGDDKAYALAIEARKKFVAQLNGYRFDGVPEYLLEMLNTASA